MNVYVFNKTGKTVYVRIVAKPSEMPGILHEMVFELYAKIPQKTKDTIAIWRIAHGDSDWTTIEAKNTNWKLENKLGWKIEGNEAFSNKNVVFTLKPLN